MKNFHIGVKALIVEKGKLLFVYRREKNFWEVPGGRVDGGEQFLETLQRELGEEIGYNGQITETELVAAARLENNLNEQGTALCLLFYKVKLPELIKIRLSDEHTEYEWVDKATALSRVRDELKPSLSKAWE